MKLTVLIDNNTLIDRYFLAEPGVSYYIEDDGCKILFDAGYSDAFIRNAMKMGIDLLDLDYVVLSHGHLDHTWGIMPLFRLYTEAIIEDRPVKVPILVAHPQTFATRNIGGLAEIGSLISEEKLSGHFEIKFSNQPVYLTENLLFMGEIEKTNSFEGNEPIGKIVIDCTKADDFVRDDSALVYLSAEGLVIIAGCAHAGICNIVEYARKLCKEDRVVDIIGGFHLLNPPEEQLRATLNYMLSLQPQNVHACHCTDLASKIELAKVVNLREVGVGLTLEY